MPNGIRQKIISNALVTYNYKTKHDVTKMTPSEAKKPTNFFEVKTRLEMSRINNRRYPDISVNDTARIYKKQKNSKKVISQSGAKPHTR